MKVGAVISDNGKTVVELVGGPVIRVRDTVTEVETEVRNPALEVSRGRRMAAVKELLQQGVEAVIAPPSTFCEHSYAVAKAQGMQFLNIPKQLDWDEVWTEGLVQPDTLEHEISQDRLSSHHHHH